jgi:hypothetical protein
MKTICFQLYVSYIISNSPDILAKELNLLSKRTAYCEAEWLRELLMNLPIVEKSTPPPRQVFDLLG